MSAGGALPPVRELKIRQPKDFKNYGYGVETEQQKGKKGKNSKMPIETEAPRVEVPGYQYMTAADGSTVLVPLPPPATTGNGVTAAMLLDTANAFCQRPSGNRHQADLQAI